MKNLTPYQTISIILIVALLATSGYFVYQNHQLKNANAQFQATLSSTQTDLAKAIKEKADLDEALQDAAARNKTFASQLDQVNQNLNRLEWVSSLDPQILQKYSKVYFLNENYIPKEISPIDTKYLFDRSRTIQIHDRVLPFLQKMLQDAALDNMTIQVASGYRSFAEQKSLKSNYRVTYGSGANAFSADQGYSEHQLATTLDFTTPKIGGGLTGFQKTDEYTWLQNNAYKYGFILSYPPNNSYYVYEPWHWRFVGIELATKLHDDGKNFYDLDQREINTYLANMFNPPQN